MRVSISSEVPATLTLTLQPVASWNGLTQLTAGSVEPSSTYPAQATMLTGPSPAPNVWSMSIFGGLIPPGPEPPLLLSEAQADRANRPAAASTASTRVRRIGGTPLVVGLGLRGWYRDHVLALPAQPDL